MKYRLLAPGPTPVPNRIMNAMNRSIFHHRTPNFEGVFEKCQKGLSWLLQSEQDNIILSCSGTGAFEAGISNFFSPGDLVINVTGGKFGERWGLMGKAFGLEVVNIEVQWGDAVDLTKVEEALKTHPNAKGLICVASETSTGVRHPYEEIASLASKASDCLFMVDAITALGVWDIIPEKVGIDVLVAGSQKALMLPPGLGMLSISNKAWERQKKSKMPRFYFDLARERKAQKNMQSAYTPAVTLMVGLAESFAVLKEEGREKIFERHQRLASATRAAIKGLGLRLFANAPSDSVTSVWSPEQIKPNAVVSALRDRANITIAGGQDHFKGKIFRIAHLGYFDDLDVLTLISALEIVLRQEGYTSFEAGAGVAAASEILRLGFEA